MDLFVDANVLLDVYTLSSGDLEELRKLVALAKAGKLRVLLPDHTLDEVRRNRAKSLKPVRDKLSDARPKGALPDQLATHPQFTATKEAIAGANLNLGRLIEVFDEAARKGSLPADLLINELVELATHLPSAPHLDAARRRKDLRQPPGKGGGIGDELNWETLLAFDDAEDLHLVSSDGDYFSALDPQMMSEYLSDEWHQRHMFDAFAFRTLGAFTRAHFPAIKFADDVAKADAIAALRLSATFQETHSVVARLSRFTSFTPEQAQEIVRAAYANSQVRWIAHDDDVRDFLISVIEPHRKHLTAVPLVPLEMEMNTSAGAATPESDKYD